MLLNILQSTGQSPQHRITQAKCQQGLVEKTFPKETIRQVAKMKIQICSPALCVPPEIVNKVKLVKQIVIYLHTAVR